MKAQQFSPSFGPTQGASPALQQAPAPLQYPSPYTPVQTNGTDILSSIMPLMIVMMMMGMMMPMMRGAAGG